MSDQLCQGSFAQKLLIRQLSFFHGSAGDCANFFLDNLFLACPQTFHGSIRDLAYNEFDGANGIIVGGDDVIYIGGVTIRIHHGNHWNIEQVGFMDGRAFTRNVDHK